MKILTKISSDELANIKKLTEKRYALFNLKKIISNDKKLLEEVEAELAEVERTYHQWWQKMISKYRLGAQVAENLVVDCEQGIIYIEST